MLASLLLALALPASAETLTLDPSTGTLRVVLYKDGPLRALGHDHVVLAPKFSGQVELEASSARMTLTIDAQALTIDEDAARAAENLSPIPEKDREKIAAGMRGPKGLDVRRFKTIALRSDDIAPLPNEKDLWVLNGQFELHGSTAALETPIAVTDGPGGRWFTGYVRLRPSDYGIKPFKVFGGAVSVKDEALVRFSILGRR